ncbi:phage integrase Arm DNA-binding domain-containing protein [Pseudomonas coronafaciens]|uniref:phage integrase Arm DNA-binding domain-containing protein n=1 Tax=Pseudomonas coronafaciens TaxID=53409 RepID=UPI000F010076|nr:phage integrase Arm DNA-binding domain-containing protein [Pseudomonas coronafaciens]RMS88769.1 Phage integrase family site specific recombinase [Pseudomonas coronafaciens pv. oryzae]RMT00741.1 Phage integrase family site specific recombinase [Pseudomonas coronafaciens pv. oryzae]
MVPRPRNAGSKDLPPNLYRKTDKRNGHTYYTYRDPVTGRMFGLGKDKAAAIMEAVAANHADVLKPTLAQRIAEPVAVDDRTFADWLGEYDLIYTERGLSAHTTRSIKSRLKVINNAFGEKYMRSIRTMDIATFLATFTKAGKAPMSKALRSLLRDVFTEAIAAGWCDLNPVDATKAARSKVKRGRLSLELWKAAHAATDRPWLKRAMELALLTGQRRDDIGSMLFKDEHDGFLHVIQSKTGARLRISTSLRLEAIDLDLSNVIKMCRDRVLSKHLVHHARTVAVAKAGSPVKLNTLTLAFAEARDKGAAALGIDLGTSPPSFHEMRSLAARLHALEGRDPQKLLGHRNAAMTEMYKDGRGSEWIDVA